MKERSLPYSAGLLLSAALAFIGGYTDAGSYVVAEVFAGHVSGNLVLTAISLVTLNWHQAILRGGVLLTFVAGVGGTALLEPVAVRNKLPPLSLALFVETLLFLIPGLFVCSGSSISPDLIIVFLALGLGIQTGALRRTRGVTVYTAFVAGMVARLAEGEASAIEKKRGPSEEKTVHTVALVTLSFVCGACTGAATATYLRRFAVLIAGLALLLLTALHTWTALKRGPEEGR